VEVQFVCDEYGGLAWVVKLEDECGWCGECSLNLDGEDEGVWVTNA
jgi:hypothetical protein